MYYLFTNHTKDNANLDLMKKIVPKHIAWVKSQIAEGSLIQAGKWGDVGGAGIIKADSLKNAQTILSADPLITENIVSYEIHRFYADVALE